MVIQIFLQFFNEVKDFHLFDFIRVNKGLVHNLEPSFRFDISNERLFEQDYGIG